jgi:hypothetical protein
MLHAPEGHEDFLFLAPHKVVMGHSTQLSSLRGWRLFFIGQKHRFKTKTILKEEGKMLGMSDMWITAAWLLTIIGMVVCVVVGGYLLEQGG